MFHIGMRVRAGLVSAIYAKSLHLSNRARADVSTGEIVNLMSTDAQRLVDAFLIINNAWAAPNQIIITMCFLWYELGPSVLAGLAVLVVLILLNAKISTIQRKYQVAQMRHKDERVNVVTQLLGKLNYCSGVCSQI